MRWLFIGLFSLLLCACWQQDEVISIESNGDMKWLVIAKPDWEFSSVEATKSDLQSYVSQMRKAGWSVQTKDPVAQNKDIVVGLSGNLQKVAKTTDFYRVHSINQASVKIEFLCPMVDDYRIQRSIKIKDSSRAVIGCGKGVQTFRF